MISSGIYIAVLIFFFVCATNPAYLYTYVLVLTSYFTFTGVFKNGNVTVLPVYLTPRSHL